jgi:nicotinate dehydrogenase subunit A
MGERFELIVNGTVARTGGDGARPLLSILRDELGLKAARYGCGREQCGACMVLIDGEPAFSCTRMIETAAGRRITTVEGLDPARLEIIRRAFVDEQAGQCGYCLSGIVVSAAALLERSPRPSREEVVAALEPHLCRCGSHNRIIRAVLRAGREIAAGGDA